MFQRRLQKKIRHGQKSDLPQLFIATTISAVKNWVFEPRDVCKDDQTLWVTVKHFFYKKIEKT